MAGTHTSLPPNPSFQRLFTALDPKSLILSQFSNPEKPHLLQLTTDSFVMERGPRYKAYADLRESKLRLKNTNQFTRQEQHEPTFTPPRKQVKFQGILTPSPPQQRSGRKGSSVLTQSVPDFSAVLRKENRKPVNMSPMRVEKSMTPPLGSKNVKMYGKVGVSKSVNSGEKRNGGMMARKSYANLEELKGLSMAAARGINGGKNGRGVTNSVLGCRQY